MLKIKAMVLRNPLVLTLTAVVSQVFIVGVANAAGVTENPPTTITNSQGLADLLCSFIIYFFWIVIIVSVMMVLYAAFLYVTAGDETEKTTTARRTLTYAAVGIAVALIAVTFPSIIASLFPTPPNIAGGGCTSLPL
jgi:heme/copper-type cytochrome/quinol oxidase subunit 2